MNDPQLSKGALRLASWWLLAVLVCYLAFNILGSRTVQRLLDQ